jgi:hypothetical protein
LHHGWRLASGATIVLALTLLFAVTLAVVTVARRTKRGRGPAGSAPAGPADHPGGTRMTGSVGR